MTGSIIISVLLFVCLTWGRTNLFVCLTRGRTNLFVCLTWGRTNLFVCLFDVGSY